MNDKHPIISWIEALPEYFSPMKEPGKWPRKRKLAQQLASPSASLEAADNDEMTSTPKKRRLSSPDNAPVDFDTTPRPSIQNSVYLSETSSVASGTSSPKKQMFSLCLDKNSLQPDALPTAARELVRAIEEIGSNRDILPHAWEYSFKPAEKVEEILGQAYKCQVYDHEEAGWNNQVHLHLLRSIFKGPDGKCDNFIPISCTTARLHCEFKRALSLNKMIDICNSRITLTQTINHTDFAPIRTRPLLLTQLQISTWLAAQWAFLRWAVAAKLTRRPKTQKGEDDIENETLLILSKLEFIPAIIVQGHWWLVVLSTYKYRKTTLWTDCQFGTTQTCLHIYATIAGIRHLTAWARDVYLPWFMTYVLDDLDSGPVPAAQHPLPPIA
ncbi:hypothetical protein F4803DRAFT_566195 [Xylaria telfairii]|nr:hypothetical protein F4803DRAFT_566195 [Xylaria telfairii]